MLLALWLGATLDRKAVGQSNHGFIANNYDLANLAVAYKNPEAERIAYDIWRAEQLVGRWGGQCVIFLRGFTGLGRDEIPSLAKNTKANSDVPSPGSILITSESWAGHVAFVLEVREQTVVVVESNYGRFERVGIRELPKESSFIIGYRIIN